MSKRIVMLTAGLLLGIVFAGQTEAQTFFKQSPISANVLAPSSASGSLHSGTSDGNHFPTVPHTMISDYGYTSQAYWMQSACYRGKIYGIARSGHGGIALVASHNGRFVRHDQSKPTIPLSSSESLSLLSPPGLILRL